MKNNFKKSKLIILGLLTISFSSMTHSYAKKHNPNIQIDHSQQNFNSTKSVIDCAILWPASESTGNSKNKIYIFKNGQYLRYDFISTYTDPGYPKSIQENWAGFKNFASGIDAGFVNQEKTKAYFFKDDQYLRYDIHKRKTDPGYPRKIAANWPGVAQFGKLDTAFLKPNTNTVYFLKGDQYLKFNISTGKPYKNYPRKISSGFAGMGAFAKNIDASVTHPTDPNKVYFFKGTQYVRYDLSNAKVDPGYPMLISTNWHLDSTAPSATKTSNYRKIIRFNTDIYIYTTSSNEFVDLERGEPQKLEPLSKINKPGKKISCKINAGFFNPKTGDEDLSTYIDEGKYFNSGVSNWIDFIFWKDGTTEIKNNIGKNSKKISHYQKNTHWVLGVPLAIVVDGKKQLFGAYNHSEIKAIADSKHPRTLIGQKADGNFILVVTGGRNHGGIGLTAAESSSLMLEFGCVNAVILDGGGSSEMIVNDRIVNSPTDGAERNIGSAFIVYNK